MRSTRSNAGLGKPDAFLPAMTKHHQHPDEEPERKPAIVHAFDPAFGDDVGVYVRGVFRDGVVYITHRKNIYRNSKPIARHTN